jgi:hypothetical protein
MAITVQSPPLNNPHFLGDDLAAQLFRQKQRL